MFEFQGIITSIDVERLSLNSSKFQIKSLPPSYPFYGVRFQPVLDEFGDDTVDLETTSLALISKGVTDCLALSYSTFGGPVEYFCGFEIRNSKLIESSRFNSEVDKYEGDLISIFVDKMQSYGISIQDNGYFEAFERDYFD